MPTLLEHMRDSLVAQGVVRAPRTVGALPPMWLEPRDGTPAPGEGQNATEIGADVVLGAFRVAGIAPRPYEGSVRVDGVDIWIRSRTYPLASTVEDQLRTALNDKRHWVMGALLVNESIIFRDMAPVERNAQAYTFSVSYLFSVFN